MGPWRGQRPPLWSQAPKAEALSLVLYLLLLGAPGCALAQPPCKEEEYAVGTECCPKCSPGYHVVQACGELTGTVCAPCSGKTYTAHHNGLDSCLRCRECHQGTESRDTVCADCPLGTFSPNGTLERCQPWTRILSPRCSPWLMTETKPGTSSTDATCSPWRRHLVGGLAAAFLLVVPVILGAVVWKRRRRKRPISDQMMVPVSIQGRGPSAGAQSEETQALRAPPSVTTVAVEETAPALA
ncbi:tumor necrosis factor receptor superfamily member 14 isoform X3 [Lepus europaeus]|uniref:tumor necrosis factor receptor superfamily member 14 isoform X3 n=1 Tax=Lepus europaeus TaxID=9983 RepID=UPI002B4609A7|nr:tumor necrosis factor receptor superfamily member 14 isoform X3 [Lepus europaeus]